MKLGDTAWRFDWEEWPDEWDAAPPKIEDVCTRYIVVQRHKGDGTLEQGYVDCEAFYEGDLPTSTTCHFFHGVGRVFATPTEAVRARVKDDHKFIGNFIKGLEKR